MPVIQFRSLCQLSLKSIVTTIIEYNGKAAINPFHQLPTNLLELIIDNISYFSFKYGMERKAYYVLEYLISPQLRFAIFYYCPEKYFLNIFPRFGKLLSLNLSSTEVGDICLQLIGTHCKILRMLDLHECRYVTDTGIRLLCFNNYDGIGTENAGLCKTLQHLLIHSTTITKQGVQMAINNLTMLKYLDHERIFEVLLDLINPGLDQNLLKIKSFPFVRLSIDTISPLERGSLGQVIQLCQSLTSVVIYAVKGLNDTDLLSLICLKNLVRFYLQKPLREDVDTMKEIQITFKGGVVPLLKKFGNSMETLNISFFYCVDAWTIMKFCPHLTSLTFNRHCDRVADLSESALNLYRNEKERFILKNLVTLDCCDSSSPEVLYFLWSFPSLRDIFIRDCNTLTDEVLKNAVKCHQFQNLKKLTLHFCDFVTKEGVDALMTQSNRIQKLRIIFCQQLTHTHAYHWHLQAKKENWKFTIYFKNSAADTYYCSDDY